MILDTAAVAVELGVSPARVRQLVMTGELEPCRRGARPLLFRLDEVIECEARRRSAAAQESLDVLAARWREAAREVC